MGLLKSRSRRSRNERAQAILDRVNDRTREDGTADPEVPLDQTCAPIDYEGRNKPKDTPSEQ